MEDLKIPNIIEVVIAKPGRPPETLGIVSDDGWKTLEKLVGGELLVRPLEYGFIAVLNMNKVFYKEEYNFTLGDLDYYGTVIFCKHMGSLMSLNGPDKLEIKLRVRDSYIARWDKEMEAGMT